MNHSKIMEKYTSKILKSESNIIHKFVINDNEMHIVLNDINRFEKFCKFLKDDLELRLLTIICVDERNHEKGFKIRHVFGSDIDDFFIFVITSIDEKFPYFPSILDVFPSSVTYESEIKEMFGVIPQNTPNNNSSILHDFPNDVFPLRNDFELNTKVPRSPTKFEFMPIIGEGVSEIPVGPIHAGIIEPGHFRFSTIGEKIIHLETRFGYTHKGVEKIVERMSLQDAVFLSERISGDESVANSLAFCQAVEKIAHLQIPTRAKQIRLVFAELERIYNHFGTLGGILTDIGFAYGASRLNILKESIMQLNEKLSGSRILFGVNQIGGVKIDISDKMLYDIHDTVNENSENFEKILDNLKSNSSVMDRLRNTGIINRQTVKDMGLVGISAKCIGIDIDTRQTHPYGYYHVLGMEQKTPKERVEHQVELQKRIGDVMSRFMSRVDELRQSKNLIDKIVSLEEDGVSVTMENELIPFSSALGYAESHRGETLHWVMVGKQNSIFRYKVRTASRVNWPIIEHAALNNIVPDFPVINKSFDFSYSGNDL